MFEPRHLEEAKRQIAEDRAAGKMGVAAHYDGDCARSLAQLICARERQSGYRRQRNEAPVRFTKLVGGFVCDADELEWAA